MNTDEIKNMVDLFADGELSKEKEPVLFTMLSQDNEAREYFKGVNYMKHSFQQNLQEYPSNLDDKVLRSVEKLQQKEQTVFINKKTFLFLSYSVVAICIFAMVIFYNKSENYKKQYIEVANEVKQQNADLKLILNTLTGTEKTDRSYWAKPVVTRAIL